MLQMGISKLNLLKSLKRGDNKEEKMNILLHFLLIDKKYFKDEGVKGVSPEGIGAPKVLKTLDGRRPKYYNKKEGNASFNFK